MGRIHRRQVPQQFRSRSADFDANLRHGSSRLSTRADLTPRFTSPCRKSRASAFGGEGAEDDFMAAAFQFDGDLFSNPEALPARRLFLHGGLLGQVGHRYQMGFRLYWCDVVASPAPPVFIATLRLSASVGSRGRRSCGRPGPAFSDRLPRVRTMRSLSACNCRAQPLRFAVLVGPTEVALRPGEEQQVGKNQQEENSRIAMVFRSGEGRRGRLHRAALYIVAHHALRLEFRFQCLVGGFRGSAIILAIVADVKVERHRVQLRPGVDRQVRFGQHQGAGSAGGGELVEASATTASRASGTGAAARSAASGAASSSRRRLPVQACGPQDAEASLAEDADERRAGPACARQPTRPGSWLPRTATGPRRSAWAKCSPPPPLSIRAARRPDRARARPDHGVGVAVDVDTLREVPDFGWGHADRPGSARPALARPCRAALRARRRLGRQRPVIGHDRRRPARRAVLVGGDHVAERGAVVQHVVPGQRLAGAGLRRFAQCQVGHDPRRVVGTCRRPAIPGAARRRRAESGTAAGPDQLSATDDADAAVFRGGVDRSGDILPALLDAEHQRVFAAPAPPPNAPVRAPARRCLPARSAPGLRRRGRRSSAVRPRPEVRAADVP